MLSFECNCFVLPSSIVVLFNIGVRNFGCKQENQKILNLGFEINITTMEMMKDSESRCMSVRWTKPGNAVTGPGLARMACSMVGLLKLLMVLKKLLVMRWSLRSVAK